jgi:hypothetical protein
MRGLEFGQRGVAMALMLTASAGWSQVEWFVDTTRIQWGEPVTLTAEWVLTLDELNSGLADSAAWPAWTDTTQGGFEVLETTLTDTLPAPAGLNTDILLRKSWVLTSWDSGFVVMPPATFGPHRTSPLLIQVLTPVLESEAQPAPPAALWDVHWTLWERIMKARMWWGSVLALLLIAGVLWWALRFWKAKEFGEVEASHLFQSHVPAHVTALQILQRLLDEEGWKSGKAKEVQAKASLAVRHYLEGQFALPAAERTTREIASLLPASAVPRSWHDRLTLALEQADAVKFAKGQLPDITHRSLLEAYISFVLETQPREDDLAQ